MPARLLFLSDGFELIHQDALLVFYGLNQCPHAALASQTLDCLNIIHAGFQSLGVHPNEDRAHGIWIAQVQGVLQMQQSAVAITVLHQDLLGIS